MGPNGVESMGNWERDKGPMSFNMNKLELSHH